MRKIIINYSDYPEEIIGLWNPFIGGLPQLSFMKIEKNDTLQNHILTILETDNGSLNISLQSNLETGSRLCIFRENISVIEWMSTLDVGYSKNYNPDEELLAPFRFMIKNHGEVVESNSKNLTDFIRSCYKDDSDAFTLVCKTEVVENFDEIGSRVYDLDVVSPFKTKKDKEIFNMYISGIIKTLELLDADVIDIYDYRDLLQHIEKFILTY